MAGSKSSGQILGRALALLQKNLCRWSSLLLPGAGFGNTNVCCDNMAVLKSRTSPDHLLAHLLCCLTLYAAIYHFDFTTEHVPGVHNATADTISRNNLTLFSSLSPQTPQVQVSQAVLDLLVVRRPDWGLKEWIQLFNRGISYQVGAVIPPSAIPMPSISSLFPNTPCANLPHQHRSLWDGGQSSPIHPNSLRLTRPFSVRFFICSKRHPQELSIHASLMPPPSLSLSSNSWSHPPIVFNNVMLWAACCLATRPPHMYLSSHQMSQLT